MKGLVIPSKIKTIGLPLTGAILIYTLVGFFILPAVIVNQVPKLVKEQLNRSASVEDISFNPFSMELTIQGFKINNPDETAFVSFEQFYTNVAVIRSILDLSLTMNQVLLKSPDVSIIRNKQADFNFSDLLVSKGDEKEKPAENADVFPVSIANIAIVTGKLNWKDDFYSVSQQEEIYPLNLSIDNFTTLINKQSDLGFSLKFASGGEFNWKGQLELSPFQSSGKITLKKINFHKIWQLFLQDSVNFEILTGSENITADYQLSETPEGMQVLINKALLNLYDIRLSEKGTTDSLITIPDFKVSGISVDLLKKQVEIAEVSAQNADFKSWLNADGSINYQALFATKSSDPQSPPSPQTAKPSPGKPDKPWKVNVKSLDINNFALNFTDKTLATPAKLNLSSLKLTASDLSNKEGASLPFNLAFTFNNKGHLKLDGQAVISPLSSHLNLAVNDIAIKDFQAYINKFVRLDIISGLFNINANITLNQQQEKPMAINVNADSHIDNFVTRDQITNKDFLNWKKLSLNKINLNVAANDYSIGSIKLDQPYARVLIRKDKTMNVNDIVINTEKSDKAADKQQPEKNEESDPVKFKVNHFVMSNGVSDFSDRSLILPFTAHINQLKGSVKGISSDKKATIKVALDGRVDNLAPVIIKGQITPATGNSNFSLDFNSMPLPIITPYMAEFAGRKIEKGNMTLGLEYKIINNQLTASNSLLIDQLVLGDEVENPEAVSLPLGLAIALLQDADGKIALDVPITGDLDNPDFSVGSIIVDALVNVISKIVTSPFYAIASLIDSDEDISKITFSAGSAVLDEQQQNKLDNLVAALSKRPALKLEIKGAAYSVQDWPLMQADALDQQLNQLRSDELIKEGNKTQIVEHLSHSDKHYQRLLADLFIAKFPKLAKRSIFGTPKLIDESMGEFNTVAENKLAEIIPPNNHSLQDLAISRAQAIAKYLVEKEIEINRVFLLDVDVDPKTEDQQITTNLSLTID